MKVLINLIQTVACTVETYELALGLLKNGVNVSLILSEHAENYKEWKAVEDKFDKMYFVDTHTSKKNLIQKSIKFIFSGRRKLKKAFKGEHYDFLINTMGNYWDPLIPGAVKADQIVTYIHDPIAHSGTKWWVKALRKQRYKQADQIVVHTKSFIPLVSELYGFSEDKIHFVPHGRLSSYKDCWVKEPFDQMYEGKINFVFFGFIQKYKGLHVLAAAYKEVSEKGYPVTLTIAGKGDFSEYQEEYGKLSNVKIINRRVKDEEIGNLFTVPNAVAVLPYLDATQSGVVITSMEFSAPIIATDTGGLKEQLDEGKIGIFCKPNDAHDLAEKMIYMVERPEEFERQRKLMGDYLHTLDSEVIAETLIKEITGNTNVI